MFKPDYRHPVKAILAPTDGKPITNVAFSPKERPYQVCVRCVMDTTDPEIEFNDYGVCNHCRNFDEIIKPQWPSAENGKVLLEQMIETVKAQGKGKSYDCIIGL
jgi:hypothetical protein